jgi:hypothetical protein
MYKGLLQILKELGLIDESTESKSILLPRLREILSSHPSFEDKNTYLEQLAQKYCVKIIWVPKFHCELNPIEGLWCFMKWFVRKENDQDFKKFSELITSSMRQFEEKNLNIKLWNRFWKACEMYQSGCTYQEVLQELFGAKQSTEVAHHKKNKNFNTLLNV